MIARAISRSYYAAVIRLAMIPLGRVLVSVS